MAITKNSQIDLNGNEMILDADADTKIDAATDDEIHFTVAGNETVYMGVTSYNASDRLVLTNTGGNASATIVASTSGESSIFMADGTSGDASYRGYVQYQHTNDNFNIGTGGAQRLRIDSDGLKFGSDTAAANALDDYEEGEWTPAVSGGTSAGTTTHTNQNGYYVKVGELVTVTCFVRYTAATGSGYLKLTGLPYAIGNRTQNYPVAATVIDGLNWGGGTYVQALSVPGLQETNFYYMTDDANATRQNLNNETAAIRFSMTYRI